MGGTQYLAPLFTIRRFVMYWRTASKRRGFLKNRGFTTVELVVTVGVMVTLAAISVPIFKNFSPSYNSKLAVRDIVSQMQLARVHAIKNRVTTVVSFYPERSFHQLTRPTPILNLRRR